MLSLHQRREYTMSRTSVNEEINGKVKNGYDYDLQVWVDNFIIIDCAHPADMKQNRDCCAAAGLAGIDVREMVERS